MNHKFRYYKAWNGIRLTVCTAPYEYLEFKLWLVGMALCVKNDQGSRAEGSVLASERLIQVTELFKMVENSFKLESSKRGAIRAMVRTLQAPFDVPGDGGYTVLDASPGSTQLKDFVLSLRQSQNRLSDSRAYQQYRRAFYNQPLNPTW